MRTETYFPISLLFYIFVNFSFKQILSNRLLETISNVHNPLIQQQKKNHNNEHFGTFSKPMNTKEKRLKQKNYEVPEKVQFMFSFKAHMIFLVSCLQLNEIIYKISFWLVSLFVICFGDDAFVGIPNNFDIEQQITHAHTGATLVVFLHFCNLKQSTK